MGPLGAYYEKRSIESRVSQNRPFSQLFDAILDFFFFGGGGGMWARITENKMEKLFNLQSLYLRYYALDLFTKLKTEMSLLRYLYGEICPPKKLEVEVKAFLYNVSNQNVRTPFHAKTTP